MSTEHEIAYRLDPVLWGARTTGGHANAMAGRVSAGATWRFYSGADGATSRQDDCCGLGDRPYHAVLSRLTVGDRLPGATPEWRGGATGARNPAQGWR